MKFPIKIYWLKWWKKNKKEQKTRSNFNLEIKYKNRRRKKYLKKNKKLSNHQQIAHKE